MIGKFLLLSILLCLGCASVRTEGVNTGDLARFDATPYPTYTGEKWRVQVLRFGVPAEIAAQYPDLHNKKVGWGLYNRLIDELFATGRFTFVEEKDEIQKKVLDQWALSQTGLVVEEQQIPTGAMSSPRFLIYAEVMEFAVGRAEDVRGVKSSETTVTRVGVQIRIVDVVSGEYVPATGSGDAKTQGDAWFLNAQMNFDETTVGISTQRAVKMAVQQMIQRMAMPK